jgi:hypothetical protein
MKKITVSLGDKDIVSILSNKGADDIMDQFYKLCSGELLDQCLDISVNNEEEHLENVLIPLKNIRYISCKYES